MASLTRLYLDSLEFGPEILASGAEPRRRSMHAVTQLTLDEHEYLVVFGGKGEEHFNDIVLLDLGTWLQRAKTDSGSEYDARLLTVFLH